NRGGIAERIVGRLGARRSHAGAPGSPSLAWMEKPDSMTVTAFALVLAAAVVHALWNLIAKRAGGGPFFVGMSTSLPALLYAPLVLAGASLGHWRIGPAVVIFIVGSALIHLGYILALQHGYRLGDLSLVYPLARGTGPILSTL